LSDALAGAIEKQGGKILYETRVEQIRIKGRSAAGVVLADGRTLPARAVVSNASALTTFEKLLPREAVPPEYLSRLQGLRPSISSFIVWLGLNRELRGRISGAGIYIVSGRGPEADYRSALAGEVDRGAFSVSLYDNVFPGYSRPGTSTLMLLFLCGFEPWKRFEAEYRAGRKEEYRREKDRWTEALIRRAEREAVPGLASLIEVREAATPLTNRRFTGNPEGAIYGFEQSLDNAFMNRLENRTPVKGLYLAGAWGSPGGGFAGALRGGELAFEQIMADWA
jgi:prolycopene isomerase